jgi:hypothetical protein
MCVVSVQLAILLSDRLHSIRTVPVVLLTNFIIVMVL